MLSDIENLSDVFIVEKRIASSRLMRHEQRGTLIEQIKQYHPDYYNESDNSICSFRLAIDLGLM